MNSWLRLSLRLQSRRVWWKSLASKIQTKLQNPNPNANTKTTRRIRSSSRRPKATTATWLHKLLFLKKKKKPPQRRLARCHVSTTSASSSAVRCDDHAHADVAVAGASPSWGIDARAEAFIAKFRADLELQEMVARGL